MLWEEGGLGCGGFCSGGSTNVGVFLWGGTSSGAIGGDGGEGGCESGGGFDVGSEMEKCTTMQPMVM